MSCALGLLQKECLLGSARILRKILDTQGGLIWKRKRLKSGNVQQKIMNKSAVLWFDLSKRFRASVDLHQWSYKYVRNVARFAYMLERKNKHSKNFVVHGRLCVQPRSGWLVPSWKIRRFSRHFCYVFSLQSIIGSLSNHDGDDYKWICATWNFIALQLIQFVKCWQNFSGIEF